MCLAIPGQVVEMVDDVHRLATVDVAGVRRTVNVGLLDGEAAVDALGLEREGSGRDRRGVGREGSGRDGQGVEGDRPLDGQRPGRGWQGVAPGDWVLIHVGFAISQVDELQARATREMLERMGADYERELEELKASVIE